MGYDFERFDEPEQSDDNGDDRRRDGPAINLTGNTVRVILSAVVIVIAVLVIIILFRGGDDGQTAAVTGTETPAAVVEDTPVIPTFTAGPTATALSTEPAQTETAEPASAPEEIAVDVTVEVADTDGDGLNMRNGPGLNFESVELLPEGTQLDVIDGPEEVDGYTWWHVRKTSDETEGWVVAQFIRPTAP